MTISPDQVVAPSDDVAESTLERIEELTDLRRRLGTARMQIEAIAMHNASLAVLRTEIGTSGVREMLCHAVRENGRVEARDHATSTDRRALEAAVSRR